MQPPLGFQQLVSEKKPFIENLLSTFLMETRGRFNKNEAQLDDIETHCTNMNAFIKSLEMQMGQLATELKSQKKGKFPSDIEHNLREQCQAIMLRSGKEVQSEKPKVVKEKEVEKEAEVKQDPPKTTPRRGSISFLDNPPMRIPPMPYP